MSVILNLIYYFFMIMSFLSVENGLITNECIMREAFELKEVSNDDDIVVLIRFDYESNDIGPKNYIELERKQHNASLSNNQKYLSVIRESNQVYYTNENKRLVMANGLENYNFYISNYSPFIFKTYDNYLDYLMEKKIYMELEKNSINVESISIFISDTIMDSSNDTQPLSMEEISIDDVKSMINLNSTLYTGLGIKIGFLERGYPDNTSNFGTNQIKGNHGGNFSHHASVVASIAAGYTGIAPGADLYFSQWIFTSEFIQQIEYLIDDGVNIINCSLDSGQTRGLYSGFSAYFDYVVSENFITVVQSAGNLKSNSDLKVNDNGMALNIITVGSVDAQYYVSSTSCYEESEYDDIIFKPNVVAPGENIVVPNIGTNSGTSFSTPIVTGVIALLMQEFPDFLLYPETYISAIMNGASMLPTQTDIVDDRCGSGLINYGNTRKILSDQTYTNFYVSPNQINGATVKTINITIPSYNTLQLNFFHVYSIAEPLNVNQNVDIYVTRYRIEIYNLQNGYIDEISSRGNVIMGTFRNNSTTKTFVIKIIMDSSNYEADYQNCSLTWRCYP